METNFNIIREFYINKENRNILNELLKYIKRGIRFVFTASIFDKKQSYKKQLCNNCFKYSNLEHYFPQCDEKCWYPFCIKCMDSHFDKYTIFKGYTETPHPGYVKLIFVHVCDIYNDPFIIDKEIEIKELNNHKHVSKILYEPSGVYYNKK